MNRRGAAVHQYRFSEIGLASPKPRKCYVRNENCSPLAHEISRNPDNDDPKLRAEIAVHPRKTPLMM